jgi:lysophospholipase L1-like esterase
MNDGNIQNKNVAAGVELKIFLNGALVKDLTAGMARVPTLFQQSLGPLKKGDTVSVAVGPAKLGERATGALRYTLEELPDGKSPAPPQNTFHLPIDAYGPQYEPDGTCAVYEAKQATFNEALLARKPELVFLGDSITSRWPQELLEQHFGAYRPVNLGVGGDRVQNVIWRMQRTQLEATPLKVLVLLIGTNNVSSAFPPEETAGGIQKLVKMVEEKAPEAKVLILGVFPRGPAIHAPRNASVDALNAKLKDLADGKKVFYLDVGPSLAEPDGSISLEVMPDQLHVALPGFLRWMEAMKPTLQSLLPNRPQETTAGQRDPG